MFVSSWLRQLQRRWFGRRAIRRAPVRRVQPCLEVLEDRTVPTTFDNVGDVATLIADITAANSSSDPSNTINLVAGTTFDLTTIDNYWYGPNGLPAISSTIVINGNGATIERDSSAPDFRLFYVSGGLSGLPAGNLTLEDLTLEGGVAKGGNSNVGGAGLGAGGAIFNQGILALNGVTLTDNTALGGSADGTNSGGGGGGGMGEDAPDNSNGGGGFGNNFSGFGGAGGAGNGGGGGFNAAGGNAAGTNGGAGGGLSGLGGNGGNSGSSTGGTGGDGGGGAAVGALGGGNGGNFGNGGGDGGGGGGGGVGGGGARGGGGGFGGGGGGDNGGTVTAGAGGFGGGGGGGGGVTSGNIGGFAGGDGSNGTGGGGGGLGGALFNMYGVVSLTNCTLADNTAQGGNALRGGSGGLGGSGYGGAIFNLDGTLNLTFCTVADNTVAAGTGDSGNGQADGGAIYNLAYGHTPSGTPVTASLTLTDSILADSNGGPHDLVNDQDTRTGFTNGSAVVTATAPNIVTSSTALNGSSINGTFLTANPQLGPLQNNGGPTSTMALLPGSLAIGAGVPVAGVTTDQRGLLRPDNPSLGAFEAQPLPPAPPSPPAPPATASIQFTSITVVPNLLALNQTETINVHVSGSSGGTVAFTVDGQSVSTSVDDNGNATVSLTLPLLTAAFPQSINAVYNGADAAGSATQTAYWWLVDALLPALDTFAADGGQAVQSYFLGLPLLDFLYTAQGRLTEVIFGPDLLSWTYSYTEVLTVVTLDGVLPVLVSARTPQGQFLGAVALTVSTDGTLVVETIDAQGQVVSSQPL